MTPKSESLIEVAKRESELASEQSLAPLRWFPEQDLWVRDPQTPSNAAHNNPLAMRIRGPLDVSALQGSVQEVVRRHSVLRSLFRLVSGEVVQVIAPPYPVIMQQFDVSGLGDDRRHAAASQLLLRDAQNPFDLTTGPMLRCSLVRLGAEDHILLLTTHHIVCDFPSTSILSGEIFAIYAAFRIGQHSPLPEPTYSYIEFVSWLAKRLEGENLKARLQFWKSRLHGADTFHHVTPDRPRPPVRSYRGDVHSVTFPRELNSSIKAWSQRERVSPFMVLSAGLLCILHRYSGQDDVGVGTCVANRPTPEVEEVIGPFGNVSMLRVDCSGDPTFRELLRRVREASLTAFPYQDVPFGTVLRNLQLKPDPSRNPLFQLQFVFLNAAQATIDCPGISVDQIPLNSGLNRYELNLWVRPEDDLVLEMEFNTDLFERDTIKRLLEDYGFLLEAMVQNPEAHVSEVAVPAKHPDKGQEGGKISDAAKYMAPSGRIESELAEMWEAVLSKSPIGVDDNFFELGGSSLEAARLFARIEQTLKVRIPLSTLFNSPTIAQLARAIEQADSQDGTSLLVPIQRGVGNSPLFCVHGQSGNLLMYRAMSTHLGPDQPVYGILPQGLVGNQPPLRRIEDMAERYVDEIRRLQPKGPYYLAGYCMGGTIAYEMAQQLRSHGEEIGLLALLDTYIWSRLPAPSFVGDLQFELQKWRFRLRHLSLTGNTKAKLKAIRRKVEESRVASSEVLELNQRAALAYIPRRYRGKVVHIVPGRQYSRYGRAELCWSELADDGVDQVVLPISPSQIFEEPFVRDLAANLRRRIDASSEKHHQNK